MADEAPGPGWWLASDGNWYPPEQHPDAAAPARPDNLDAATVDLRDLPRLDVPPPGAASASGGPGSPTGSVAPTGTVGPAGSGSPAAATGLSSTLVVGLLAAIAVALVLVIGVAFVVGGDDGGDGVAAGQDGGSAAAPPAEVLPFNSQDRGCWDSDHAIGCLANPAPPGTRFLDESREIELTFDRASVRTEDTDDPINPRLVEVTIVVSFANQGDEAMDFDGRAGSPYSPTVFSNGLHVDACSADPRDGTFEPGTTTTVTWVCATSGPSRIVEGQVSVQLEGTSASRNADLAVEQPAAVE